MSAVKETQKNTINIKTTSCYSFKLTPSCFILTSLSSRVISSFTSCSQWLITDLFHLCSVPCTPAQHLPRLPSPVVASHFLVVSRCRPIVVFPPSCVITASFMCPLFAPPLCLEFCCFWILCKTLIYLIKYFKFLQITCVWALLLFCHRVWM